MGETLIAGRYELVRLLGKGGMGSVHEARHTGTGRRVAVKIIAPELAQNRRLLRRFEVEARAAGAIESDHIAQVLDVGFDEARGSPFLVMEYLEGEDLSQLLKRAGALEPEPAFGLFAQACKGLDKAHRKGIIHRDIKPANLFLAEIDDDLRRLKILDFGIAKIVVDDDGSGEPSLTRSGALVGSPLYMSPEQARARGGVDHRSDLWSLGVVLYEMLTGRAPFAHLDAVGDLIIAICSEPPPPLQKLAPWLGPEVEALVAKALAINPSARFQSAAEMLTAVRVFLPNGVDVAGALLLPPSYRRNTGELALSKPFALAQPSQGQAAAAVVSQGTDLASAAPMSPAVQVEPPAATTRTTSAAVSDTTSVVEESSPRVAVMGAVGVLIGASLTLWIGLQVASPWANDRAPEGSAAPGAGAVVVSATASAPATSLGSAASSGASLEAPSAAASSESSAQTSVSATAASAGVASSERSALPSSQLPSSAPVVSVSAAPKLTGRLPQTSPTGSIYE